MNEARYHCANRPEGAEYYPRLTALQFGNLREAAMRFSLLLAAILACLLASCRAEDRTPGTIVLQPLGRVSASDISTARHGIEAMFSARVEVRPAVALPKNAY